MGGRVQLALAAVLAACLTRGQAQVVELSGGTSTLYQSQGATLKLHGQTYESGLSGGMADGHLLAGAYFRKLTPKSTYTLGMQDFNFNLPTDLFGGEHRITVFGAGWKTARPGGLQVQGFLGAASNRMDSPFVQGFTNLAPAAAVLMRIPVSRSLNFSTQVFDGKKLTAIGSVEWTPRRNLTFGSSFGFAGDQHYAAISMDMKRPRQDLALEYIRAGDEFQRTGTQADQALELIRENISYTYRSSLAPRFTFTVLRQNFLVPGWSYMPEPEHPVSTDFPAPDPVLVKATISGLDEVSVGEQIGTWHLSQSVFHSGYKGDSNLAYALAASTAVTRRAEVQSSFFKSYLLGTGRSVSSLVTTVRERVTNRVSISETINYSGGQPTVGFGGSLLTGLGNISADYQTVYIPTRPENPFQQSLMLDVQLSVFGRMLLHVGTLVSPTGKLLYTADAHATQGLSRATSMSAIRAKMGASMLTVRVVDTDGNAVEGAAIEIDGMMGFTDSDGNFFLREKKPALHTFRVAVDSFLDGHTYRVVQQPMRLASSKGTQTPSTIVVAVSE